MCQTIPRAIVVLLSALLLITPLGRGQSTASQASFDTIAKRAAEARSDNNLDEAVLLYRSGLALRPDWAEGWSSLGRIEFERRHYIVAKDAFGHVPQLSKAGGTLPHLPFSVARNREESRHVKIDATGIHPA